MLDCLAAGGLEVYSLSGSYIGSATEILREIVYAGGLETYSVSMSCVSSAALFIRGNTVLGERNNEVNLKLY